MEENWGMYLSGENGEFLRLGVRLKEDFNRVDSTLDSCLNWIRNGEENLYSGPHVVHPCLFYLINSYFWTIGMLLLLEHWLLLLATSIDKLAYKSLITWTALRYIKLHVCSCIFVHIYTFKFKTLGVFNGGLILV